MMDSPEAIIKKLIFKIFSFTTYLRIVSRFYFFLYNTGFLRRNENYKYHYFLRNLISNNNVIIDIGANLGYYTIPFSKWAGPDGIVYALEPVQQVRDVLLKNISRRRNIKVLPYALGKENKSIRMGNNTLQDRGVIATGSHFVLENGDNAFNEFSAEMRRGSELFSGLVKIDFIKCDVEGYEPVIIPEIESILIKHKPIMLIETKKEKRVFIIDFLQNKGFKGYILENNKLFPVERYRGKTEDDILFIHESRIPVLSRFLEK